MTFKDLADKVDQMLYEKREDGALHAASYEEELLGE